MRYRLSDSAIHRVIWSHLSHASACALTIDYDYVGVCASMFVHTLSDDNLMM